MKMEINVWDMKRIFQDFGRDYWSMNGLDSLLEYYDGIDENMEFDPVGICCDCTEYGGHGAVCSKRDFVSDYGYQLDVDEWMTENGYDDFAQCEDEYIGALCEVLEEYTTVLYPENGNIIVFTF